MIQYQGKVEGVYLRPAMKFTRNEISNRHEKNSAYITFDSGLNKMKFRFEGIRIETTH